MNNLFKVILGIAAGFLIYYTLHVLIAVVSLAVCAVAVMLVIHAYKMSVTKKEKA